MYYYCDHIVSVSWPWNCWNLRSQWIMMASCIEYILCNFMNVLVSGYNQQWRTPVANRLSMSSKYCNLRNPWFHAFLNSVHKVLFNFSSLLLFTIAFLVAFILRLSLRPTYTCSFKQSISMEGASRSPA